MISIQDKIKELQQMQQIMRLVVKVLATKNLVEEDRQAAMQSVVEVAMVQV